MIGIIKRIAIKLRNKLDLFTRPDDRMLVSSLIVHVSNLEMSKDERTYLAPLSGVYGPFVVAGNSLPVIEYQMFEKGLMQFIKVRVEIAPPDKIRYITKVQSECAPEMHNREIETLDQYKVPFQVLALHLYRYFPIFTQSRAVRFMR